MSNLVANPNIANKKFTYFFDHKAQGVQYSSTCNYKESQGKLKLIKRTLCYNSDCETFMFSVSIDNLNNIEIIDKLDKNKALIKIQPYDYERGYIFKFEGENCLKNRDHIHELLLTKKFKENDNLIKECFSVIPLLEKKKYLNLLTNPNLFYLYKEICLSDILKIDDFVKFLRKKHNYLYLSKFDFIQNVQISSKYLLFINIIIYQ